MNAWYLNLGKYYSALLQKAGSRKGKLIKYFIKIFKSFYSMKDPVERMKNQIMDWVKIFVMHLSDKVAVSRIHKEKTLSNSTVK